MLANVQQKTIQPIIEAAVTQNTLIYTDEYDIYARLEAWGYRHKAVPDYPFASSGDDDPVRMGRGPRAGVGQALGQGIQLVAAVEAPGEAG